MTATERDTTRLTRHARGGGCACKIPPGELESIVADLLAPQPADPHGPGSSRPSRLAARPSSDGLTPPSPNGELVIGLDDGDDAAVVRVEGGRAIVATADFFTPVVDDPYDWGRIAATNALSDVYAVGGTPVVAVNLLAWPRQTLPTDLARAVLRGGLDVARIAGCHVAGGHSVDGPEPMYGMAVTGLADPERLLRIDEGRPGMPISLTKPLGVGVLNTRHKATGEVFPQAIEAMTTLNRDASLAALAAGARCATDVTGFGLLGHLYKLARASGVTALVDVAAVPYLEGAREAVRDGHVSGGTRRNLAWVAPHLDASRFGEEDLLLLADAQTSGGLLVAGEIPGAPVVGELVPRESAALRLI
ncbi:selenide, water dikinase SelD [Sphaerimonospora thailandensis]|uniref:Selenide, water dikinase n=1 Tax=Sphaerimonospora thailandensis TaxID=795644 RepID=A0A8J3RC13_9ACTN|nr:selenide, water dikinase SelD [Sphaerimonospora thailandensis]GIH71049.1 selenide, water dikinase [Sphaerimonospora thailandensis]